MATPAPVLRTFALEGWTHTGAPLGTLSVAYCSDGYLRYHDAAGLRRRVPMYGDVSAMMQLVLAGQLRRPL